MIVGTVIALLTVFEAAVKVTFRWRTWRDRGLAAIVLTLAAAGLLSTAGGTQLYEALRDYYGSGPGAVVIVPALAAVLGLSGFSPLLFAFFLGIVHPDPELSAAVTLPVALGNLPQSLFLAFTLPPSDPCGFTLEGRRE